MKYQKFIPEGWHIENKLIGEDTLNNAIRLRKY